MLSTNIDEYRRRLSNVVEAMERHDIDCLLLNQRQNVRYLTAANNTCSWVFLKRDGRQVALVLESDYPEYRKQSIVADVRPFRTHDPLKEFRGLVRDLDLPENGLAIEKEHLRYYQFEMLREVFGSRLHLGFDGGCVVLEAAMIKTPEEIEKIAAAARLATLGMQVAQENAVRGITETELARRAYGEMVRQGAGSDTYLYLASDVRSSLAHAPHTDNVLDQGPVVVDIHTVYQEYHADMARTIFLGEPNAEQVSMYDYLRDRVGEGIRAVRVGITLVELRRLFYQGLKLKEDWVMLSGPLVHGVGMLNAELPKFEYPHLSRGYPEKIEQNVVLAMSNLGLCSRQGWGVRFEDTFLVTQDGPVVLTGQG